jgi:hypothetical protein
MAFSGCETFRYEQCRRVDLSIILDHVFRLGNAAKLAVPFYKELDFLMVRNRFFRLGKVHI